MNFKKSFLLIILIIFLFGCSSNHHLFIESDNYHKYSNYYYTNIELPFKKYKLIGIFNNEVSFKQIKEIISLIKIKYFHKIKVYAIILYPYGKEDSSLFNTLFDYINNLEFFLSNEKKYNDYLYVIGIPQNHMNIYQVLIYFNNY